MTRLYPFYRIVLPSFFVILYLVPSAWAQDLKDQLSPAFKAIEPKVIKWRRDIHQHPELSNREFRTAKLVAEHLRNLGMEVQTGVAHTGVVGTLRGGKPGPVVALRADMDALPVTEMTDVPFASKVRSAYNGQEVVSCMHAGMMPTRLCSWGPRRYSMGLRRSCQVSSNSSLNPLKKELQREKKAAPSSCVRYLIFSVGCGTGKICQNFECVIFLGFHLLICNSGQFVIFHDIAT